MRQYVYAIFWGTLIGFLTYAALKIVKFKTNTVRLVTSVIIGVSVFTMVGLQVERFTTTSTSGINIVSASYGSNADPAQVGNRTKVFQGLANGLQTFNTTFNLTTTGGDPVPGKVKDLKITYTCNGESAVKSVSLSAEANSKPISITCPVIPPAIFPAAPVATGISSSLTAASGLAPASSSKPAGPNMNEIYVTEPVTCGALNGKIVSSGLCGIQAS